MAEWSKAPDSRYLHLQHQLGVFWSTDVGVGSNPTSDTILLLGNVSIRKKSFTKKVASAGNRTPINCLEGNYADHYTTDACMSSIINYFSIHELGWFAYCCNSYIEWQFIHNCIYCFMVLHSFIIEEVYINSFIDEDNLVRRIPKMIPKLALWHVSQFCSF